MSKRHLRVFLLISIVSIVLTSAVVLRADVTGSILGVVHDRSQAVVAGWRRGPRCYRSDPARPPGIGQLASRQPLGERPARYGERLPGEWRRCECRTKTGRRLCA